MQGLFIIFIFPAHFEQSILVYMWSVQYSAEG